MSTVFPRPSRNNRIRTCIFALGVATHYTGPAFIGTVGTVCSGYLPWAFYATFLCSPRFRGFVTHTVSNRPSALCGMLPTTLLRDCPAFASHHVSRHGLCRMLTIENRATKHLLSSERRGSNPRHQPWKGRTLPTELLPRRSHIVGGIRTLVAPPVGLPPPHPLCNECKFLFRPLKHGPYDSNVNNNPEGFGPPWRYPKALLPLSRFTASPRSFLAAQARFVVLVKTEELNPRLPLLAKQVLCQGRDVSMPNPQSQSEDCSPNIIYLAIVPVSTCGFQIFGLVSHRVVANRCDVILKRVAGTARCLRPVELFGSRIVV